VLNTLTSDWQALPDLVRTTLISTAWIIAITVGLILCVAYLTLWER
jgi:hypothetical protein